jgi:hypothetical protein
LWSEYERSGMLERLGNEAGVRGTSIAVINRRIPLSSLLDSCQERCYRSLARLIPSTLACKPANVENH